MRGMGVYSKQQKIKDGFVSNSIIFYRKKMLDKKKSPCTNQHDGKKTSIATWHNTVDFYVLTGLLGGKELQNMEVKIKTLIISESNHQKSIFY